MAVPETLPLKPLCAMMQTLKTFFSGQSVRGLESRNANWSMAKFWLKHHYSNQLWDTLSCHWLRQDFPQFKLWWRFPFCKKFATMPQSRVRSTIIFSSNFINWNGLPQEPQIQDFVPSSTFIKDSSVYSSQNTESKTSSQEQKDACNPKIHSIRTFSVLLKDSM